MIVTSVFDGMAAARAKALVARKNAVAWKVNRAALEALRQEAAIEDPNVTEPSQQLLFGLPLVVDSEDQAEEPRFWMIAEKPKADEGQ